MRDHDVSRLTPGELEHAITFYDRRHPAAPARAGLHAKLDAVTAEGESRRRLAGA